MTLQQTTVDTRHVLHNVLYKFL